MLCCTTPFGNEYVHFQRAAWHDFDNLRNDIDNLSITSIGQRTSMLKDAMLHSHMWQ